MTFSKRWQSETVFGVVQSGNASKRIIVLCAEGDMGFLPNTKLIYKAKTTTGDYHGQMTPLFSKSGPLKNLFLICPKKL